jgi:hypothetical protein
MSKASPEIRIWVIKHSLKSRTSTRRPPGCVTTLAAALVNYEYTTKISQKFRRPGITLNVIKYTCGPWTSLQQRLLAYNRKL